MDKPHVYKIEVALTKSQSWGWFLHLAKKEKSYRIEKDGALEIHVVETENLQTVTALWQKVRAWKNTAFYMDEQLLGPHIVGRLVWHIEWEPEKTKRFLDAILKKHENAEAHKRWRMGLGEDPRGDLPG